MSECVCVCARMQISVEWQDDDNYNTIISFTNRRSLHSIGFHLTVEIDYLGGGSLPPKGK